jgi:DNA-binding protein Fis
LLRRIVQHTAGNISQAARILGIDRGTLRTKLKSLGISTPAPSANLDVGIE